MGQHKMPRDQLGLFVAVLLAAAVSGAPGDATLTPDKHILEGFGENVTVSWENVVFGRSSDWIGMWPESANLTLFSAPIKFKYIMKDPTLCPRYRNKTTCEKHVACAWAPYGHPNRCWSAQPPPSGNVTFFVQNMREPVRFVYGTGDIQYPAIVAQTDQIRMARPNLPQGAHLALGFTDTKGSDASQMQVYWQAGGNTDVPGVLYATSAKFLQPASPSSRDPYAWSGCSADAASDERMFAPGYLNPGRQYTRNDFCDTQVQPAGRQGWMEPGNLLEATMTKLVPGTTYYYRYGDNATGWSAIRSFVASPAEDAARPTTIAAFGDMGQTEQDGSFHHSWDFGDHGELPSQNTTDQLYKDKEAEMVLHIGDIAYAVGFLSEWNNFFWQIEPVSSLRPWMASIGNHEQGWSRSLFAGQDSGGECGVPFNAHFPFASQDPRSTQPWQQRQPWYAFRYGPVTFVQMSTEHDFSPGSVQYKWLSSALAAVNRAVAPWLVFSGHRPMYIGSDWPGDHDTAKKLQGSVEDLLFTYDVDLAIWGHFHAFQRFCKLAHGKCVNDSSTSGASSSSSATDGVTHLVIGMAGYDHSQCPTGANW